MAFVNIHHKGHLGCSSFSSSSVASNGSIFPPCPVPSSFYHYNNDLLDVKKRNNYGLRFASHNSNEPDGYDHDDDENDKLKNEELFQYATTKTPIMKTTQRLFSPFLTMKIIFKVLDCT